MREREEEQRKDNKGLQEESKSEGESWRELGSVLTAAPTGYGPRMEFKNKNYGSN